MWSPHSLRPAKTLGAWQATSNAAYARLSDTGFNVLDLGVTILELTFMCPGRLGTIFHDFPLCCQSARSDLRRRDVLPLPEPSLVTYYQYRDFIFAGRCGRQQLARRQRPAATCIWFYLAAMHLNYLYLGRRPHHMWRHCTEQTDSQHTAMASTGLAS